MKYLGEKPVPISLSEVLDPTHTAVVVIDAQNDFCHNQGIFPRHGVIIPSVQKTIQNISKVLDAARKLGVWVVFVQHTTLPHRQSDSPSWARFMLKTFHVEDPNDIPEFTLEGTWGQKFVDPIRPREDEVIIKKHRSSGFVGTDLDLILKSNGIKTIITTGVTTEGCVESTSRDGQFYDYMIVTLRDCVNSESQKNHIAALEIMKGRWDVVTSSELFEIWSSSMGENLASMPLRSSIPGKGEARRKN